MTEDIVDPWGMSQGRWAIVPPPHHIPSVQANPKGKILEMIGNFHEQCGFFSGKNFSPA